MTNIPTTTGLSDNEKESNWETILPLVMLGWSIFGLIICYPNLFIRCCQFVCCKKQSAELSSNDKKQTDSQELTKEITMVLGEKLIEDKSNSPKLKIKDPNNSPMGGDKNLEYIRLDDTMHERRASNSGSDSDDNAGPPKTRSLGRGFR